MTQRAMTVRDRIAMVIVGRHGIGPLSLTGLDALAGCFTLQHLPLAWRGKSLRYIVKFHHEWEVADGVFDEAAKVLSRKTHWSSGGPGVAVDLTGAGCGELYIEGLSEDAAERQAFNDRAHAEYLAAPTPVTVERLKRERSALEQRIFARRALDFPLTPSRAVAPADHTIAYLKKREASE